MNRSKASLIAALAMAALHLPAAAAEAPWPGDRSASSCPEGWEA